MKVLSKSHYFFRVTNTSQTKHYVRVMGKTMHEQTELVVLCCSLIHYYAVVLISMVMQAGKQLRHSALVFMQYNTCGRGVVHG